MMAANGELVGFTREGARRIAAATRALERANRLRPAPQPRYPLTAPVACKFAKSGSGGVPALSGSTPGSALITLYDLDVAASPVTLTAGDQVMGFNASTTAVGGNKWLVAAPCDGGWAVIVESC
jgi:hypothetical protein